MLDIKKNHKTRKNGEWALQRRDYQSVCGVNVKKKCWSLARRDIHLKVFGTQIKCITKLTLMRKD